MPEAEAMIKRAVELDPRNPLAQSQYGIYLLLADKFPDAVTQFKGMIDNNTGVDEARLGLWTAYHHLERYDEAYEQLKKEFEEVPALKELLELGYRQNGYKGAMLRMAEMLSDPKAAPGYILPTNIAKFYVYAGEKDKALEFLEKGHTDHDSGLVTIQVDPDWKTLRNEPRFQAIVKDMGFPN